MWSVNSKTNTEPISLQLDMTKLALLSKAGSVSTGFAAFKDNEKKVTVTRVMYALTGMEESFFHCKCFCSKRKS